MKQNRIKIMIDKLSRINIDSGEMTMYFLNKFLPRKKFKLNLTLLKNDLMSIGLDIPIYWKTLTWRDLTRITTNIIVKGIIFFDIMPEISKFLDALI